ncbi:MAG: S8 family serine peptidase, partial [Chloroflexi bacterium]|nr:S8 family serine peptidase [Chloroflexota bacterium]
LNLATGLLLGLAAGLILGRVLLPAIHDTSTGPGWDVTLGGLATGAALLILATGFGYHGLQLLLMFSLPALGWAVAGLAQLGRARDSAVSWPAVGLLVGLAAATPALFIDPDELTLYLVGEGEIIQWAFAAAIVAMFLGWFLGLPLFFLRHRLAHSRPGPLLAAGAALALLAGLAIYGLAGQPGFYGEQLFVILKDQADVSAAAGMGDYDARRQFVYDTLVNHADTTQAGLRQQLDRLGLDYTPYYLVNAIAVEGGPAVRLWLASRPEVDRIIPNPILRPLPDIPPASSGDATPPVTPDWNLTFIGADRVWQEFGVTGEGVVVGQSDSGVQGDHPELAQAYRGRGGNDNYNWFDPWNHSATPVDIGGHGTHTLGSIVGASTGVAPGAEWLGCVNLARNLGNPALYLDCLQFLLAPFPLGGDPFSDGDPTRSAHVLNNSWGCPEELEGCDANSLLPAVRALRAAGIFVIVSAGNEGPSCGSVRDPLAIYDEVFSVGAIDPVGNLAFFSSQGPVTADGSGRTKPDIVAPGVEILSAFPNSTYTHLDGTSMAGPHVAGVVTLLWSAAPALVGDIERTEEILIATAQPYSGAPSSCAAGSAIPNNAVGYGVVDAYAAVKMVLDINQIE